MHYTHMPGLGGLRRARRDSSNTAWRNASFRGYADYMQTVEFDDNLSRCIALARRERVVLMCAEAVPWRCHRSLIADALIVRGIEAMEITSGIRARPHALTRWARVRGTRLTYPAARAQTTLATDSSQASSSDRAASGTPRGASRTAWCGDCPRR
jgi:uncharacterized protein (DUF488 family)